MLPEMVLVLGFAGKDLGHFSYQSAHRKGTFVVSGLTAHFLRLQISKCHILSPQPLWHFRVCRGSTDPRSRPYQSLLIDPLQTLSRPKHAVNNKCTKSRLLYRTRAAIVFLLKDQTQTIRIKTKTKGQIGSGSRPRRPYLIRSNWGASTYHARGECIISP